MQIVMMAMQEFDLETYTNSEVIAVDQDALGIQGKVIWENCHLSLDDVIDHPIEEDADVPTCQQIWARPLSNGSYAVVFLNYDVILPAQIPCGVDCFGALGMQSASVRDLWAHEDLGVFSEMTVSANANGGSQMFTFTKVA